MKLLSHTGLCLFVTYVISLVPQALVDQLVRNDAEEYVDLFDQLSYASPEKRPELLVRMERIEDSVDTKYELMKRIIP